MSHSPVAVSIGHYSMPSAVELNLAVIRRHCGRVPIIVHDDASPRQHLPRLIAACRKYRALLRLHRERLGHVGGDLRAFHDGLIYAERRGCPYLLKLSQRAIIDVPGWLHRQVQLMEACGAHTAAARAGIAGGQVVAHVRTSSIILKTDIWSNPAIMQALRPRRVCGYACEAIVARCLQFIGGCYLQLDDVSNNLQSSAEGEVWHDDPRSHEQYQRLAEREGIVLGDDFHVRGWNAGADGKRNPDYF